MRKKINNVELFSRSISTDPSFSVVKEFEAESHVQIEDKKVSLTIVGCQFKEVTVSRCTGKVISIIDTRIEKLTVSLLGLTEVIEFVDCTIGVLDITEFNIPDLELRFVRSKLSDVSIRNTVIGSLYFNNCNFKVLQVFKARARNFAVTANSVVSGMSEMMTLNCHFEFLQLNACSNISYSAHDTDVQNLIIGDGNDSVVRFHQSRFEKAAIHNSKLEAFQLSDCTGGVFNCYDSTIQTVVLSVAKEVSFIFKGTNGTRAPHDIQMLYLLECRQIKDLRILESKISNVQITDCSFGNAFEVIDSIFGNALEIRNSNLGKLTFNNIHIEDTCNVSLLNSNVLDVVFSSFRWNKNYRLTEIRDGSSGRDSLLALRESYRQLKANYFKNNNKIEALEFQKHELEVHYQILAATKWSSFRDFGNFLVVGSNRLFSDFGQNIWKPLLFLFGFHLLLFNFLLIAKPELGYRVGWPVDWNATWKAGSLYFETILPTHLSRVKGYAGNEVQIGGLWDFAMRVFAGYFIFYFISASRKYHQ